MWQFLVGFSMGLYTGTFYNCKPHINNIIKTIKFNIPEERK